MSKIINRYIKPIYYPIKVGDSLQVDLYNLKDSEFIELYRKSIPMGFDKTEVESLTDYVSRKYNEFKLPVWYAALKMIFKSESSCYNQLNSSFGFAIFLEVKKIDILSHYVMFIHDPDGYITFELRRILSPNEKFRPTTDELIRYYKDFTLIDQYNFLSEFIFRLIYTWSKQKDQFEKEYVKEQPTMRTLYGYFNNQFYTKHFQSYQELEKEKFMFQQRLIMKEYNSPFSFTIQNLDTELPEISHN